MTTTTAAELTEALVDAAERFPPIPDGKHFFTLADRRNWARRTAFDIGFVVERVGARGAVCDVGGGYGLFAIGCARLGMRSILVEDFFDIERLGMLDATLAILAAEGVEVRRRDILAEPLDLEPASLDAITCFHVLEHLPASPRPLFHQMRDALRPGGAFVLAGPNAVNLRKRVAVPLGRAGWSPIEEWYGSARFRGHVREPRAQDLRYIASDLGLRDVEVRGANFLGTASPDPVRRGLAHAADRVLRTRAALCSDLYMAGETEGGTRAPADLELELRP